MNRKNYTFEKKQHGIILYDFLYCLGGAEKVTITLAKGIPNTDICVGFRDRDIFNEDSFRGIKCLEIGDKIKLNISALRTIGSIYAFSKKLPIQKYDWAVFSGSYAPLSIRNRIGKRNICYCHTIPRFAYDLQDYYMKILPIWKKPAFLLVSSYLRRIYKRAMAKMDIIVANSKNVQKRIKKHLNLDSIVIYPPCDPDGYKWINQGDYYLSTGRLERYKRIDTIIEAFKGMPRKKLIVASGGSDYSRLIKIAGNSSNIKFLGWATQEELKKLVGRCIASIYIPRDEDFGMSPVESMASGKPVIGVSEGGLLETIVHDETGLLIRKNPKKEHLVAAVEIMTREKALKMRDACEKNAERFSNANFIEKMRRIIYNRNGYE